MSGKIIERTAYLAKLDSYRKNRDLVKVITGVRRCGKSELMRQFRQHLISDGVPEDSIIHIDLERRRYVIDSERMLYETIRNCIKGNDCYVLLDEVQLVKGWERVVSTIRNEFDADVYVTGSNSKMLSDELGTNLTGRYVTVHILPFSFKEFLNRYPVDTEHGYIQRLEEYILWGGMPILDLDDDPEKNLTILSNIYDSIVNHDIRPRVEMDQGILDNITAFMLSNTGNLTSMNKLAAGAYVNDPRTVERYLTELERCFLFYRADRYDIVGSKHLRTNAKFYPVDTGMVGAILYGRDVNMSALLESVVFIELVRRGYRISVGSFKGREIDFTAWKSDGTVEFYQVCMRVDDRRTLDRELAPFRNMEKGHRKVLILMDCHETPEVPEDVECISAAEWLMQDHHA